MDLALPDTLEMDSIVTTSMNVMTVALAMAMQSVPTRMEVILAFVNLDIKVMESTAPMLMNVMPQMVVILFITALLMPPVPIPKDPSNVNATLDTLGMELFVKMLTNVPTQHYEMPFKVTVLNMLPVLILTVLMNAAVMQVMKAMDWLNVPTLMNV